MHLNAAIERQYLLLTFTTYTGIARDEVEYAESKGVSTAFTKHLKDFVMKKNTRWILMPIYHGDHYSALALDLERKVMCFGDSNTE